MLLVYLTAYMKIKGKNRALSEDLHKMEDEKQNVIAKYRAETEELKKQHTLDIEKRKFQYEDKRTQFSKYFSVLDEFHRKSNSISKEEFLPVITEFMDGFLNSDEKDRNLIVSAYLKQVQDFIFKVGEEQLKVKSEQHSIRLIASKSINDLLDELEVAVDNATEAYTELLKYMSTEDFWADQSTAEVYQEILQKQRAQVLQIHNKLKSQMNKELHEI